MLTPCSYPKSVNSQVKIIITPCKSSYICKRQLVAEMKFTFKVTGKTYLIKGDFPRNSKNVIYLSPFGYVKVQIIEHVYSENPSKIEEALWCRGRY